MRKLIFSGILLAILVVSCQETNEKQVEVPVAMSQEQKIERGAYLIGVSGCNDCHSPKKMTPQGPAIDSAYYLAGHPANMPMPPYDAGTAKGYVLFHMAGTAMIGPWGTSYAANLTPHGTGMGNWDEEKFFNAIRHGYAKGIKGGRMLLPPMPWEAYKDLPDEDISAMYAYLMSIPPVENIVPSPTPPGQ